VLSIQLQANGSYLIKVIKLDAASGEEDIEYYRSRAVLNNPGAFPFFPDNFFTELFPTIKKESVITGDSFLKKETFIPICRMLKEIQ